MSTLDQEEKFEIPPKYLAALNRFKIPVALAIVVLGAVAAFVAVNIPATYRSEGIVLVETQQIPDELVQSTITSVAAERIQIIRQRVMTRDRMLTLMDEYPTLRESLGDGLVSKQVQTLRENVNIELIQANSRSRNSATIAFRVAYDSNDPVLAQAIANDLVTMFLDENVRTRTQRAEETTGFLQSEASKMRDRLAETEIAIANFKAENKEALPEHLDLYLGMLERARTEEVDIRRQIEVATNQIALFQNDLATNQPVAQNDPELRRLEAEYARLTSLFKDTHPDVRAIKQQIATFDVQKTSGSTVGTRVIENNITASRQQISLLNRELDQVRENIAALEERVVRIPQVEQGLIALNRDYEAVKSQYDNLVNSTMQAQMAESLEQGRKAERFALLEAPVVPDEPHSPDRKMILGGGLAASAGLPLALVLAIGFFDSSVRGRTAVERALGQMPLVTVGVINPSKVQTSIWPKLIIGSLVALLLGVAAIVAVHFFVMPLDTYFYQFVYKFNLEGLIQ